MENIIFFKKAFFAYVIYGALPPLAQVLNNAVFGWISAAMIIVMMIITILPEMVCFLSNDFRIWVKKGIENGDGTLHGVDLWEFTIYYGTFLVMRVFIIGFLVAMMGTWNPPFEVLYSPLAFVASGGLMAYAKKEKR